jgi:hypothetical protein
MRVTADRGRPTAIGFLLLFAVLALPAKAQFANYTGWEWEGRALEPIRNDTLQVLTPPDDWLAHDKALHVGASFLITLSSQYVFENKFGLTDGEALPLAMTAAFSAGVLKEVLDSQRLHSPHFCTRDLVADVVGVLFAAGIILL